MKTRNALIVLAVLVIGILSWTKFRDPPDVPATEEQPKPETRSRSGLLSPGLAPQLGSSSVELLGTPVPKEAQPYMAQAVQSSLMIEHELRKLPTNSVGRTLLSGLSRRLFVEDYRYAAYATGALDHNDAVEIYEQLLTNLKEKKAIDPLESVEPVLLPGTTRMADYYMPKLEDPMFKEVWEHVVQYDPVGTTDVFKDALLFAGLNSEMRAWIEEKEEERRQVIQRHAAYVNDLVNSEGLSAADRRSLFDNVDTSALRDIYNSIENNLRDYHAVQSAYRNIFTKRFWSKGVDPAVLDSLVTIDVMPIGEAVTVP
jgi:hypothetical protein